jgi:hypothetical protein
MRPLLVALALLLLSSCSSDSGSVCAQACNRLHGCGLTKIHLRAQVNEYVLGPDCGSIGCDPITECVSRCFMQTECRDLDPVVTGSPFHLCLIGCSSYFRSVDGGS